MSCNQIDTEKVRRWLNAITVIVNAILTALCTASCVAHV